MYECKACLKKLDDSENWRLGMDFLQGYYTVFDSTTDPHEIGFIPHTGSTKVEVEQQADDLTE